VQGEPPFVDERLPAGGGARVLLTCRPGVVVADREREAPGQGQGQQPAVVVPEDVVAMPPQKLAARV
jgi:hypothetical protein